MKRNSSKTAENSAKRHSGFTLVELVVVIAVLAILAGVGAVAYRGYIDHAKKAGDLELLGAVNDAFSSACVEYDIDRNALPTGGARIESAENGDNHTMITGVDLVYYPTDVTESLYTLNENFSAEFLYVFEPNDEIAMQYYTTDQILFDGNEHMFVFVENAKLGSGGIFADSSFAGKDVGAVSQSTKWGSALIESLLKFDNFSGGETNRAAMTRALKEAMNGNLTEKSAALLKGLKDSEEFKPFAALLPEDLTGDNLAKILEEKGVGTENPSYIEMMNGIILASAEEAVKQENVEAFKEGKNSAATLPLLLGELTAYYNSDAGQKDTDFVEQYETLFQLGEGQTGGVSVTRLATLMGSGDSLLFKSSGWQAYKNNKDQANKDIDAYVSALEALTKAENKNLASPDMFGDFLRTMQ